MWGWLRGLVDSAVSVALDIGAWVVERFGRTERDEGARAGGDGGSDGGDAGDIDLGEDRIVVYDSDEIPVGSEWRCAFLSLSDAVEYARDIPCPVEFHFIDGAWWVKVTDTD